MRTWPDTQSCESLSGHMLLSWPLSREGIGMKSRKLAVFASDLFFNGVI